MIRAAARILGKPGVQFWLASTALSRSLIPRPTGTGAVHTTGTNPARILLIGSGASVGLGVLSHDLALAGHLARQLSTITGRAMDVDVVTDREMTAGTSVAQLARQPIHRYDAILLSLGLIEALTFASDRVWVHDLEAVLDMLESNGRDNQQVFVMGIPPLPALMSYPLPIKILAGRQVRSFNALSEQLVAGRERVTFLPFDATNSGETDRFRSSQTYGTWAALFSEEIAARLCTSDANGDLVPIEPVDETARQLSLDALNILDTEPEERFDRITSTARDLLGTTSAAITFVDRERHWLKSRIGVEKSQMPRLSSLCDITIQRREHFAIEDATADPRFAGNSMVVAEPFLRFYAGYPIEAPNGVRVGTLSVFDPVPRVFSDADAALLRGLALMVQNELRSPA